MPAPANDDDFRLTALDWMGKPGTPLDIYARSGRVERGLDRQLQECLDLAERGIVPSGLDSAGERKTLAALLRHLEPELTLIATEDAAVRMAAEFGEAQGRASGESWLEGTLSTSGSGRTAAALRLYLGVDGPERAGDAVPPRPRWSSSEVGDACGWWREPSTAEGDARVRWATTRIRVWDEYVLAFHGAVEAAVSDGCRAELADSLRLGRISETAVDRPARRSPSLGHEGPGL